MFQLRPYQQECIDAILTEARNGVTKQIMVLATGLGKAQPLYSKVLTSKGWVRMGDILKGDRVISSEGKEQRVLGVYPQGIRDIYKVNFSDSSCVDCDLEHLWKVQTKFDKNKGRGWFVKTLKELKEDLYLKNGERKWFLPLIKPAHFEQKEVAINPYLLGALIGDGCLKNELRFSNPDAEIVNRVSVELEKIGLELIFTKGVDYRIVGKRRWGVRFGKLLKGLGLRCLSVEKKLPVEYLYNSIEVRLELLRGLMDTDGTVSKVTGVGEFSTSSKILAEQVLELVRSLGGVPTMGSKIPKYTYKGEKKEGKRAYRVRVSLQGINPFYLARKANKYNLKANQGQTKAIVSIEKVGAGECQCIFVDSEESLYVTDNYTLTHNTVIFSHLPPMVKAKGMKTLILAQKEELLYQAKERLLEIDTTLKVGIEQAEKALSIEEIKDLDVIIASVPTLGRKNSTRINKFSIESFGLIILDEAQHSVSTTHLNILRYFDVLKGEVKKPNGRVLLGCTATPTRTDKIGLDKVFDKIVFNYPIRKGIEEGYLVNIQAYTVQTEADISNVSTSMGDFAEGELAEEINTDDRNKLIVDSYREIADHSKALVFAVNVEHAKDLTEYFKSSGYRAVCITAETDKVFRAEVKEKFEKGEIEVIVNISVYSEGVDLPCIETVLMARPTKSSIVYQQAIGRGVRLYPGKDCLKLIDFVDNTGRNSIMGLPTLFGMPKNLKTRGKKITEVISKAEKILEVNPDFDVEKIEDWSEENIDKIIKRVDIFAQAELPAVVKQNSKYAWNKYLEGYRIDFPIQEGVKEVLAIQPNMLDLYEIKYTKSIQVEPTYLNRYQKWENKVDEVLSVSSSIFDAFKEGDKWVNQNKGEYRNMLNIQADWRDAPPTEKQLEMLKKFRIPAPKGITKGQCSNLIGKHIANKSANFRYGKY